MKKVFFLFGFSCLLFAANWYWFISSPVFLDEGSLLIKKGDNLSTIESRLLKGNRAFFPHVVFRVYVYLYGSNIKPGYHQFENSVTFRDVFHGLEREPGPVKARLPEGDRASAYAQILANLGVASERDLLQCFKSCKIEQFEEWFSSVSGFEGFLFPDTYFFTPASPPKEVLSILLGNFSRRIEPLQKQYKSFIDDKGLRQVVIIASLLEREGRDLEEKRVIAGILYRRLFLGMRLDVDASVLYAIGDWKAVLTVEHLNTDSAYNTRKFTGLPPGPIANPSLESLEAAMSPIASNYLYYLTGKDNKMHYAATLEEHVQNKRLFL